MAITLAHLRTLTVEQLEALKELHGDTLTDQESEKIDQVLQEKREGDGNGEGEEAGEGAGEDRETGAGEGEGEETGGEAGETDPPPSWWKDPPSVDEIADSVVAKIGEAERVADQATGRAAGEEAGAGEGAGREVEAEAGEGTGEGGKGQTTESEGKGDTDDSPKDEHWFYRGGRKRKKAA